MKKIIPCLLISFITIGCGMTEKQKAAPSISITISVIPDVTDPRNSWPAAGQIIQQFHCDSTPDAECQFRLRTISDLRHTPIYTYTLPNATITEQANQNDDPQLRNKNIKAFYGMIEKAMGSFYSKTDTTQSLTNSECLWTIADELSILAKSPCEKKELIVASDLREKSLLGSFYSMNLTNETAIAALLEKTNLFPSNLNGIKVIFLFEPKNREEDIAYSHIVEAYKKVLVARGADVSIQANL